MSLMSLNLATLNAKGLRDPSKCARLLGEISNISVIVAAVQETHLFALRTVGYWRTTLSFFQHTIAIAALGSFSYSDGALMLM